MKIIKRLAPLMMLGVLVFGFSTTASARRTMSLSNGIYGEVNVGYGNIQANATRNSGLAGSLLLGYKFNTYLAVDGGVTLLPKANTTTHNAFLALKGIWPLGNGDWDFFGRAGVAAVEGQNQPTLSAKTEAAFYFGAGFTYWFQQNFGITFQGSGTTASDNNVPATYTLTTGLAYFF